MKRGREEGRKKWYKTKQGQSIGSNKVYDSHIVRLDKGGA